MLCKYYKPREGNKNTIISRIWSLTCYRFQKLSAKLPNKIDWK